MKRIFLVSILSLCTVALMAQTGNANRNNNGGNRGEGRTFNPEQRYDRLKQELKLNDKQIDSLKVAEKEIFGDMGRGTRTRGTQATQESKEKATEAAAQMKKKNEQFEVRLKNFLTAEQITKYKELRNRPRTQNQDADRDPNQRQGQGQRQRQGNSGGN
jgi:hypothetical protein